MILKTEPDITGICTSPEMEELKQLFDLNKDPNELNNVYNDPAYTGVVNDLKKELLALKVQLGDEDSTFPEMKPIIAQYW